MRNTLLVIACIPIFAFAAIHAATVKHQHQDIIKNSAAVSVPEITVAAPDANPAVHHTSVQSTIAVAWRHQPTGACMQRNLNQEQEIQVKKLLEEGKSIDDALLGVTGTITINDQP